MNTKMQLAIANPFTTDINDRLAAYQMGYFLRVIESAQAAMHLFWIDYQLAQPKGGIS